MEYPGSMHQCIRDKIRSTKYKTFYKKNTFWMEDSWPIIFSFIFCISMDLRAVDCCLSNAMTYEYKYYSVHLVYSCCRLAVFSRRCIVYNTCICSARRCNAQTRHFTLALNTIDATVCVCVCARGQSSVAMGVGKRAAPHRASVPYAHIFTHCHPHHHKAPTASDANIH